MDNSNQEYIRSYWRNELTETERQAFEQKCVEDESFANSVAQFMQLKQIATETAKDKLKDVYQQHKKTNRNKVLMLIAGLILIGVIAFRMFFLSNNTIEEIPPVSEEQIFAMLVEEHQDANRGDDDIFNQLHLKFYEAEQYDTLIAMFGNLNLTEVHHVNELVWVSQALYQQDKNTEIINLIDDYMKNNLDDISRKDELLWLQTLAYLAIDDNEKAKSNLEEILNKYRLYKKEAKRLLDELK